MTDISGDCPRCGQCEGYGCSCTTEEQQSAHIDQLLARIAELTDERDRQYDQNAEFIVKIAELEAALETARADALREAADVIRAPSGRNDIYNKSRVDAANAILALIDAETDPQPVLPRTSEPQATPVVTVQALVEALEKAAERLDASLFTNAEHAQAREIIRAALAALGKEPT